MKKVKQSELVLTTTIKSKLESQGYSAHHITRNLRTLGYILHRTRRTNGHLTYALTKADAKKYLATFDVITSEESKINESVGKFEEQVRQQREKDGWFSFRLTSAGMPDLINIKRKKNGLFEILFEEVKSSNDGIRKEQNTVLEFMKRNKIPSVVTWL